jgi:hypothetical protein
MKVYEITAISSDHAKGTKWCVAYIEDAAEAVMVDVDELRWALEEYGVGTTDVHEVREIEITRLLLCE